MLPKVGRTNLTPQFILSSIYYELGHFLFGALVSLAAALLLYSLILITYRGMFSILMGSPPRLTSSTLASRFLHPALFFVGCGVLACAGGLLLIMVLSDFARALGEKRAIRARQSVVKVNFGRPGPAPSKSSIDITGAKKMPSKTDR
jgi:hypothetical protein